MASASDRATGSLFLLVALLVFGYYTLWVMALPFLAPEHPLQAFFLPRVYAIALPVALLLLGLSGVGAFLASVVIKQGKKKAKAA